MEFQIIGEQDRVICEQDRNTCRLLLNMILEWRSINRKPTYGDLARPLNMSPRKIGRFLGILSTECHNLSLPLISAIVIKVHKRRPGIGFFNLASQLGYGDIDYEEEQERVFQNEDWQRLTSRFS